MTDGFKNRRAAVEAIRVATSTATRLAINIRSIRKGHTIISIQAHSRGLISAVTPFTKVRKQPPCELVLLIPLSASATRCINTLHSKFAFGAVIADIWVTLLIWSESQYALRPVKLKYFSMRNTDFEHIDLTLAPRM